ncbi:MAG: MBL fold metallo-hydrolase [Planctomycetota bacterium]|jgi:glyoxylase-like metal-dependent hydrolase (beta-lactamase superfamily II)
MSWDWTLLRAGAFKLDGGAMFGMIPRPVWLKTVTPDDRNRIGLQTNCLLLRGHAKTIVIEAGIGDKMSDKLRAIYDAEERSIEDAVRERGVEPDEVDAVVISHLHFDHAGGLTRLPRDGEDGGEHNAVLTFPNAEVIVQQEEWDDAIANKSTMHSTYLPDHLGPIADRVRVVGDGDEVMPGMRVRKVPGHTWGQQAILFEDDKSETVVFTSDLLATCWHAPTTWGMAYDVESYTSMVQKKAFLHDACENDWVLVLPHDPEQAVVRARPHQTREGEHVLVPA